MCRLEGQANVCSHTRVHPWPPDLCFASGQWWPGQRLRDRKTHHSFRWPQRLSFFFSFFFPFSFVIYSCPSFFLSFFWTEDSGSLCQHNYISLNRIEGQPGCIIMVYIIIPHQATLKCIFFPTPTANLIFALSIILISQKVWYCLTLWTRWN